MANRKRVGRGQNTYEDLRLYLVIGAKRDGRTVHETRSSEICFRHSTAYDATGLQRKHAVKTFRIKYRAKVHIKCAAYFHTFKFYSVNTLRIFLYFVRYRPFEQEPACVKIIAFPPINFKIHAHGCNCLLLLFTVTGRYRTKRPVHWGYFLIYCTSHLSSNDLRFIRQNYLANTSRHLVLKQEKRGEK